MTEQALQAVATRSGKELVRRSSLAPLGTALFAFAIGSIALTDGTSASKKTKRIKLKKCKKQAGSCRAAFDAECQGDPACDPLLACCDLFSNCDADAGLRCIFTLPEPTPEARGVQLGRLPT